ncbi:MAG: hypothetical protein ACXAE3_10345 [Candidatus Kariarchaeaceae archaeon]|jgi:hypothetical protein
MELGWKVILDGADPTEDDDLELEFIDTSNILGEPTIERQFLDDIIKNTRSFENYSVFRNLKKIYSDTGKDMTGMAIWCLLGIVQENSQRVGLLLGSLIEGGVHIIAAWPTTFADQLRGDISLIDVVLDNFSSNPSFWKQVDLIIGFR